MDANEKELREDLQKAFSNKGAFSYGEGKDLYVILIDGKRATLTNGKSVWANLGAAKNSMRYFLDHVFWNFRIKNKKKYDSVPHHEISAIIKEEQDAWVQQHVVYVPYSDYIKVANKVKMRKKK